MKSMSPLLCAAPLLLLFAAPALAQQGQPSVEEMEAALGVNPGAQDNQQVRFRSPTFELEETPSNASPAPAAAPSGGAGTPGTSAPMSFAVPIEFDFGSTQVSRTYQPTINRLAEVLRRNPGLVLRIRGHTDAVGSPAANDSLSQRRAEAVRAALIQRGTDRSRLLAEGYGERALLPGVPPADASNRRVEFIRLVEAQ